MHLTNKDVRPNLWPNRSRTEFSRTLQSEPNLNEGLYSFKRFYIKLIILIKLLLEVNKFLNKLFNQNFP